SCPACRGAGFVHPLLPSGKPDYSRIITCNCAEKVLDDERRKSLKKYSNLGPLSERTFDSFIVPDDDSEAPAHRKIALAVQAARSFADKPSGWLVLLGPSGTGKTHLAAAIANQRISLGYPVFFESASNLLDHLRSSFHPDSEIGHDELFERVKNTPLLILDDLGHHSATSWAREKLDQIINHRFNYALPSVFTSSLSLKDMGERWNMRLSEPRLSSVFILGESYLLQEHGSELELEGLKNMTFDNFQWKRVELPLEARQAIETAYKTARQFADNPEGWLVLEGPHGSGKTHLAAAIANQHIKQGKKPVFKIVPELLDHLRSTFSPDSKVSYDELFEQIKKAQLLILDDLGGHSSTAWAQEKLYQLINYRYNAKLPTVFTTPSRDELEDRICSRLDDHSLNVFTPPLPAPYYQTDYGSGRKTPDSSQIKRGFRHQRE
ncbi:MAG: ATP-binding protein, partial [Dehalococcoidia bacterium]|nr:ATP-binding protein [Dehalococcoidia bacterium]